MFSKLLKVLLLSVATSCHGLDAVDDGVALLQGERPSEHSLKAHSNKMSNLYLRKRTEKVLHKGTDWLMSKMPGAPQMFGSLIEGGIKDFVMQLRSSSASRQRFIDLLTGDFDNATVSDLGVKQVVGLMHNAAHRAHLEEPVRKLLDEAESQLSTINSTANFTPQEAFHMLSNGMAKLGAPAEVTNFMDGLQPLLDSLTRPEGPDPTKLFSFLGTFYKSMGMPAEVVDILGEFGSIFSTNGTAMEGPQAMKFLGKIVKKLGLPEPITDFLDFMGQSMESNTTDNATAALAMIGKAMTGMGAPPEMTGAIMEIAKLAENSGNDTSADMMTKIGGLMKGAMGGSMGGDEANIAEMMKGLMGAATGGEQPQMPANAQMPAGNMFGPQMLAGLFSR